MRSRLVGVALDHCECLVAADALNHGEVHAGLDHLSVLVGFGGLERRVRLFGRQIDDAAGSLFQLPDFCGRPVALRRSSRRGARIWGMSRSSRLSPAMVWSRHPGRPQSSAVWLGRMPVASGWSTSHNRSCRRFSVTSPILDRPRREGSCTNAASSPRRLTTEPARQCSATTSDADDARGTRRADRREILV